MHKAVDEGCLTLATGPAQYVSMARNLAASIRFMDGTRRIRLVHDEDFRIDACWDTARPFPFAITGSRQTKGEWKGADIAQLPRQEGAPCLVQMKSGVFCFNQTSEAATFFGGARGWASACTAAGPRKWTRSTSACERA